MSRYTVNLSRARSFSRKKRAQKAMKILQEKLEEREGEDVSVSPEVNAKIWERGAEKPPATLEVEVTEAGGRKVALLPGAEPETEEPEPEEVEEEQEQEEDEEPAEEEESEDEDEADDEYDDILSGTVGEAKDAIKELDSPDYERLLELEEDGKDRKTLKQFIENQM
ncbi:MAG: hypothetical protein ABEI58_02305 [Candidatus Nanohaloarchaea archaeon]